MILNDAVEISGARRTRDGYLVADCRVARAGNIQVYTGRELERPDLDLVRVYRDPEAIFDSKAMGTWAFKPMTVQHPAQMVTADNWRDHAVGLTGAEIVRDGEFIRVPMCLMDAEAIAEVEGGTRELSCGYLTDLAWEPGTTPSGEAYDARVVSLTGNHIAVVKRGRAGSECRIGDTADAATRTPTPSTTQGGRAMPDAEIRTVVVDGLSIPVTNQGAEVINRLQRQMTDAAASAESQRLGLVQQVTARDGQIQALRDEAARLADAHQGAVAALTATHQQALDGLRGELDALRAQTSDAALDARVAARSALIASARRVLGDAYDATGQSDVAIRRAVVAKALPTLPMDDSKGDAYVTAAFDAVMAAPALTAAPAAPDPLRVAIAAGAGGTPTADAAAAIPAWKRAAMRVEQAYRNPGERAS